MIIFIYIYLFVYLYIYDGTFKFKVKITTTSTMLLFLNVVTRFCVIHARVCLTLRQHLNSPLNNDGFPGDFPSILLMFVLFVLFHNVFYFILLHTIFIYGGNAYIVLHCIVLYCIVLHCITLYCIVSVHLSRHLVASLIFKPITLMSLTFFIESN